MRPLEPVAAALAALLPTGAPLMIAEPWIHVSEARFGAILQCFREAGFLPAKRVRVGLSRALVMATP